MIRQLGDACTRGPAVRGLTLWPRLEVTCMLGDCSRSCGHARNLHSMLLGAHLGSVLILCVLKCVFSVLFLVGGLAFRLLAAFALPLCRLCHWKTTCEQSESLQELQLQVLAAILPVALATVDCNGTETSLLDCSSKPNDVGGCNIAGTNLTDATVLTCSNTTAGVHFPTNLPRASLRNLRTTATVFSICTAIVIHGQAFNAPLSAAPLHTQPWSIPCKPRHSELALPPHRKRLRIAPVSSASYPSRPHRTRLLRIVHVSSGHVPGLVDAMHMTCMRSIPLIHAATS